MVICLKARYSNYATKSELKKSTGVDTFEFLKRLI